MKANKRLLIKSLRYIGEFPTQVHGNADEYLKIHHRNSTELKLLAEERKSEHIPRLVNSFEYISKAELNDFIKQKQQGIGILDLVLGRIVAPLFRFIKNNGNTKEMITQKITQIAEVSLKLAKIVENPFYEEVYDKMD